MAAKFGVEAAPTLLVVCNGDPNTAERFQGEFKSGPISDFLSKFAGGRKCATAVKVRTILRRSWSHFSCSCCMSSSDSRNRFYFCICSVFIYLANTTLRPTRVGPIGDLACFQPWLAGHNLHLALIRGETHRLSPRGISVLPVKLCMHTICDVPMRFVAVVLQGSVPV